MTDTETGPGTATDAHRFPCPQCGATYRYEPQTGALVCDHCGHRSPIDEAAGRAGPWGGQAIRELDFREALRAAGAPSEFEETRVVTCTACGAQVEVAEELRSTDCPFCASPIVDSPTTQRHIKPGAVLPFAIDENAARQAMTGWLGRLWFAPTDLQRYARKGRRMTGIYTPYWTFDARTRSRYRGQRGTVHYTSRTVTRNGRRTTERVQHIRWRSVQGQVARAFDDVLVLGARSLPKTFTDALPPWDLSRLAPYAPEYLAGMRAEAYTIEIDEAFHEARTTMDRAIERDVRFDIGGDRQRIDAIDTQVADVTYKHVLLPIWIAAYRFRGKTFRIVINGQTGRVQGERPWSAGKIALAVLVAVALAAAIGVAIAVGESSGTLMLNGY